MSKKAFLFFVLSFFMVNVYGQEVRKYANDFMNLGAGARGAGMGNTQTAIVNDITASYWNPAGLTEIKTDFEIGIMHAEYFAGSLGYNYGGFSARIDSNSVVGFSVIRLGADNIPDTRELIEADGSINYDNVTSFSNQDYAFLGSYARKIKLGNIILNVGGNLKVIHRTVGNFGKAWGTGLDVGVQFRRKNLYLGAMFRDISGTYTQWNLNTEELRDVAIRTGSDVTEIPVNPTEIAPPSVLMDIAYNFQFSNWNILTSLGGDITWDGRRQTVINTNLFSIAPRAGTEVALQEKVFLRAGLQNFQILQNFDNQDFLEITPTFGMGFRFRNMVIDYALTQSTEAGAVSTVYSHIFSLRAELKNLKKK